MSDYHTQTDLRYQPRQIQVRNQISLRCNRIEHRVHLRLRRNPPSTIYIYLDLPSSQILQTHNTHRHNTTLTSKTLAQAAHTLSPQYKPTPPQPKHRHISHFPHIPPELGKLKPNPVTPQHLAPRPEPNTYTCHTLHLHLSPHSSLSLHLH